MHKKPKYPGFNLAYMKNPYGYCHKDTKCVAGVKKGGYKYHNGHTENPVKTVADASVAMVGIGTIGAIVPSVLGAFKK